MLIARSYQLGFNITMAMQVSEELAFTCCSSRRFAQQLAQAGPLPNIESVLQEARRVWWHECGVREWLAAFDAHPKIGQSKSHAPPDSSAAAFLQFSKSEQSTAAQTADEHIKTELADWNERYAIKFGFIFIICAKGRSSQEILAALKDRYRRLPHEELQAAAQEQMKITEMRLRSALGQDPDAIKQMQRRADQVLTQVMAAHASKPLVSPITTHVLDTAKGCPAKGLSLKLMKLEPISNSFEVVAQGVTNEDGRVPDLLPPSNTISPGRYRMFFDTTSYLLTCHQMQPMCFSAVPFYPEVTIDFEIAANQTSEHYHIPLLLSPYGYSTYRGS